MNLVVQILAAILNSLWQAAIVAALTWLALKFLPRVNAATRYVIWWVVLGVVLILPAAPRLAETLRTGRQAVATAPTKTPKTIVSAVPSLDPMLIVVPVPKERASRWPAWALGLWTAVLLYRLVQIVRSYIYLCGVRRRASISSHTLPSIQRPANLLLSPDISSPMAIGFLHPAVILPETLPAELEKAELEHILLHEAAHLVRLDDWTNLAGRLLGAPLALHPVAVWILRRIEREREMACDDWVVARAEDARPYAAGLARMFELRWSRRKDFAGLKLASGIFGGARFAERIDAVLASGREFSSQISLFRIATGVVALGALAFAGSMAPRWIVFAQGTAFTTASVKPFIGSTQETPTFRSLPEGKLQISGYPLQNIVAEAYSVREEQIEGRREWMNSERFDIDAQAAGNPGREQLMQMLQALLEEKFHLRVHRETRQLPVLVMTLAPGGLKAELWKEGSCPADKFRPVPAGSKISRQCGSVRFICNGTCEWNAEGTDMAGVTDIVSTMMGLQVIDRTGYANRFNIHFKSPHAAAKGDFIAMLAEGLGLQLTRGVGPVEFLVIDEVEKPNAK